MKKALFTTILRMKSSNFFLYVTNFKKIFFSVSKINETQGAQYVFAYFEITKKYIVVAPCIKFTS
jgi:hypothetical protein